MIADDIQSGHNRHQTADAAERSQEAQERQQGGLRPEGPCDPGCDHGHIPAVLVAILLRQHHHIFHTFPARSVCDVHVVWICQLISQSHHLLHLQS